MMACILSPPDSAAAAARPATRFITTYCSRRPVDRGPGLFVYGSVCDHTRIFPLCRDDGARLIVIPVRDSATTENMLRLGAGHACASGRRAGRASMKVITLVTVRAAKAGHHRILLCVARISGETAPLLFTALNKPVTGRVDMEQPMANLRSDLSSSP